MKSDDDAPILTTKKSVSKRQLPSSAKARPVKRTRLVAPTPSEDEEDDQDNPLVRVKPKAKAAISRCRVANEKPAAKVVPRIRVRKKSESYDEDDLAFEEGDKASVRTFKEGQRTVCPPMGDPARAFYESLIQEKPQSIIAIRWCVEHGVLIGSQHKNTLKYYKALKAAGAFKPGNLGGLRNEFCHVFETRQRRLPPLSARRLERQKEESSHVDEVLRESTENLLYDESMDAMEENADELLKKAGEEIDHKLEEAISANALPATIVKEIEEVASELQELRAEVVKETKEELRAINEEASLQLNEPVKASLQLNEPVKMPVANDVRMSPPPLGLYASNTSTNYNESYSATRDDMRFTSPLTELHNDRVVDIPSIGKVNYNDLKNGSFFVERGPIDLRNLRVKQVLPSAAVAADGGAPSAILNVVELSTLPQFIAGSNVPVRSHENTDLAGSLMQYLRKRNFKIIKGQCVANCSNCTTCVDAGDCIEFEEDMPISIFPATHGYFRLPGLVRLCQNDLPQWTPLERIAQMSSFRQMGQDSVKKSSEDMTLIESDEDQWPDDDDSNDPSFENDELDEVPFKKQSFDDLRSQMVHRSIADIELIKKQVLPRTMVADVKAIVKQALIKYWYTGLCRRNYTSICPIDWKEKDKYFCVPPEDYTGFCGELDMSALQMRSTISTKAHLDEMSETCAVQWPCITHVGRNLKSIHPSCPTYWTLIYVSQNRHLCVAPTQNRRCGLLLETSQMSPLDKSRWAYDCEEDWDIQVDSAVELQREADIRDIEEKGGDAKFTPLYWPAKPSFSNGPVSPISGVVGLKET